MSKTFGPDLNKTLKELQSTLLAIEKKHCKVCKQPVPKRRSVVRKCFVCKRKVSDGGETWYGGHPHSGWFKVNQTSGSTQLRELQKQRDWDVCSGPCLIKLADQLRCH